MTSLDFLPMPILDLAGDFTYRRRQAPPTNLFFICLALISTSPSLVSLKGPTRRVEPTVPPRAGPPDPSDLLFPSSLPPLSTPPLQTPANLRQLWELKTENAKQSTGPLFPFPFLSLGVPFLFRPIRFYKPALQSSFPRYEGHLGVWSDPCMPSPPSPLSLLPFRNPPS